MDHLEQVQHCTDLPTRSHFQRTQSRERWGEGCDECYCSSREEEGDKDRQKSRRKEKEEAVGCPTVVVQGAV